MKKIMMAFIGSLFLILTFGCGAMGKATPVETGLSNGYEMVEDKNIGKVYLAPGFDFNGYDVLLVLDPSTASILPQEGIDPEEMKIYLKTQLIKELGNTMVFPKVTDDKSILSEKSSSTLKILVLESTFTEIDPGNRALRYFFNFGVSSVGSANVQVETELRDYVTKTVYFKGSDRRSRSGGVLGGDSKGLILNSLSKISKVHAVFVKRISSGGKIERPDVQQETQK